jgi:hypothetical protein
MMSCWEFCARRTGLVLLLLTWVGIIAQAAELDSRLTELNAFWVEVSRSVREGNFEGYRATCHPKGVFVSASKSFPLATALAGWEQGFRDTEAGKIQASVAFRFSARRGDATTAHEIGIFHYFTIAADGQRSDHYVHFEALLLKEETWQILMEYQKGPATAEEWDSLK